MRAHLKLLKTYNVPQSQAEKVRDFEEICKAMRVSQSSIIVSMIGKFVKENRRYLSQRQKQLEELNE